MGVSSFRELGRTLEGSAGGTTIAKRRFVVILDDSAYQTPTDNVDVVNAVGGNLWGTEHPEFQFLGLSKVTLAETFGDNPYHVEVSLEYTVLSDNQKLTPLARKPEWSFETVAGEQVPALSYYEDNALKPLTNSANDYFEGLTVPESLTRAVVKQNFAARPDGIIGSFGYVNEDQYAGASPYHLKHEGSDIQKVSELWGNASVSYWRAESKLLYRPTGWNLQLPDVGFNAIVSGQKRRAMVFDFENGEWVPSPTPVGLDGSGGQAAGAPSILNRQVLPSVGFQTLFGAIPS